MGDENFCQHTLTVEEKPSTTSLWKIFILRSLTLWAMFCMPFKWTYNCVCFTFKCGKYVVGVIIVCGVITFAIIGGIGIYQGALQVNLHNGVPELKVGTIEPPKIEPPKKEFRILKPSSWF